ncbi:potassium transporter Kup [Rothia uropygialis]|uniref:potassium transporter Kup n=1 Tax=Kocuria sp. 36 TaxID=1415402 RepID=UPI001EE7A3D5|nr:KUP/HAK/KT family potassium transporter [Kocuria sp. 36]
MNKTAGSNSNYLSSSDGNSTTENSPGQEEIPKNETMALALGAPRPASKAPIALIVAAVGVVFGDIGTSPLYSMQTVFSIHNRAIGPSQQDVLGVISMVIWCLLLIVTVAYIGFILRAHNQGEGGILSLASLIWHKLGKSSHRAGIAIVLAVVGASLFYGDSLITPAISVMSAIEGVEVANPGFAEYIIPISVLILCTLFAIQRWGTASIGKAFGPIMVTWFLVLLVLGIPHIVQNPSIFRALSPTYAIAFALDRPFIAFIAMGAVVLAVTGVEALYADMGHFGRKPIMLAWLSLVLPALAINYLGQGAMILDHPETVENPFFHMAPHWARIPLVVLAACATVIASQAVISGAFSVSRQATRLSLLPRLRVVQTSKDQGGQIYMPTVNLLLFLGVLTLVLVFRSSSNLAAAYGLSVTGTLLLELSLFLLLARAVWKWSFIRVATLAFFVGGLELLLFGANVVKVLSGGWLPLLIAACFITVMLSWRRGSRIMWGRRAETEGPIEDFVNCIHGSNVQRVPGVAVYPHGNPSTAPLALGSNLEFNHVLHRTSVIITMKNVGVPHVRSDRRIRVTQLGDPQDGIIHVLCRVGFNDSQDVPQALRLTKVEYPELEFDPSEAIYILSVFRIEPGEEKCMPRWQKVLFRFLEKFSANRTQALHLPLNRTTVMGAQAEL